MFKTKLENFHITFFEQRFEMNICSICAKSLENAVYPLPEGSMSQNFDLGLVIFIISILFLHVLRFTS